MATRFVTPRPQFEDNDGRPLVGGTVEFFASGTSSPKDTYSDAALTTPNANPITLGADGRPSVDVFLGTGSYKTVLKDALGNVLLTSDPVDGADAAGASAGGTSAGNLITNGDFRLNQRTAISAIVTADAAPATDGWLALTQTATVAFTVLTDPEAGQTSAGRMTQPQASAQRMGYAQWIPSANCRHLRSAAVAAAARVRFSVAQPLRYALLEWTGTADVPTLDPVNDWTSGSYTAGGFFVASGFVVLAVGSTTPSANVWTTLADITGTASGSMNNLCLMVWTEGTAAQNVTLDLGLVRVNAGAETQAFERRPLGLERLLTTPNPDHNTRQNLLFNGGFEVWQRGSSISIAASTTATASVYTADGWCMETSANQAMTVSRDTGSSDTSQYSVLVQRNAGQTGTSVLRFQHPLELEACVRMRGQYVSISCLYRSGADFAGTLRAKLYVGTGTEGRRTNASAYTTETTPLDVAMPITAGQSQVLVATTSVVVPTTTTQASVVFEWTPSGTAGAADAFKLDDVMVNIGPAPMLFVNRPFYAELADCQRWYCKSFPYATAPAQNAGNTGAVIFGQYVAAGLASRFNSITFPQRMRAAPTMTTYNPGAANAQMRNIDIPVDCSATAVTPTEWGFDSIATMGAGSGGGQRVAVHFAAEASL